MSAPVVFISYSHLDRDCKDRLVIHLKALEKNVAILDEWDDQQLGTGEDWEKEIMASMNVASVAVLMISPGFLASDFIIKREVPRLLEREKNEGLRIFPIIIKSCMWKEIDWLKGIQAFTVKGEPLSKCNENEIDDHLVEFASEIKHAIGIIAQSDKGKTYIPLSPEKISLARMPSTSPDLFGRENRLDMLDKAWDDPKTNIVTLVAFGGVGKTALVNKWLNRMEADNYRGAERVLGWSFYSQGATEGKQASADQFIAFALERFGDPNPSEGSPWDKGERLANLVRQYKTLLILDGLEPLQYPPGVNEGRLKDPGLQCLLRELASHNPGLCIVITRLNVDDIKGKVGDSVEEIELENLSQEAGAQLLEKLGVIGTSEELKQAVDDFKGHALALTLLGTYLKTVYHGDIRQRDKIAKLTDERKQGAHARRVMESYETWFKGKPELNILYIMGLFDKPAEGGAIEAVKNKPTINGLTSELRILSHQDWMFAVENLRTARLLAEEESHRPDELDCHPLVREYFGIRLRENNTVAWKKGHTRLYEWYESQAKKYPDTIEEMAPLYSAVSHSCQAGMYRDALGIYRQRVLRGEKYFSWRNLGTFGADLAAMSGFFDVLWSKPVNGLAETDKAFVLNQAGLYLRSLGRLSESTQPFQESLKAYNAQKDMGKAAIVAYNLSELYLTIGDTAKALDYAEQSVKLADQSGDTFWQMANRAVLADAMHQIGRHKEAEDTFKTAEAMQKKRQLKDPILYSVGGFQYCDLLLEQGKYEEVLNRASKMVEITKQEGFGLLHIALDNLSLGRAYLLKAQIEKGDFAKAVEYLDQAVSGLRQSGFQYYIPLGLLARASLRRIQKDFNRAKHDIDEAFNIASRDGMGLHLADCHLEYARLYFDMGEEKAKEHLATAKEMIDHMGYHRRDKEVQELEAKL